MPVRAIRLKLYYTRFPKGWFPDPFYNWNNPAFFQSKLKNYEGQADVSGNTITDKTANWEIDQFAGQFFKIKSGIDKGQIKQVISNTQTQVFLTS